MFKIDVDGVNEIRAVEKCAHRDLHARGEFLELEVTLADGQTEAGGTAIAHDLMTRLGVKPGDLVSGAYLDLLRATAPASGG